MENKKSGNESVWNADSIATLIGATGQAAGSILSAKQSGNVAASQAAQAASAAQLAQANADAAEKSRRSTYLIAGSVASVLALALILTMRRK